MHRPACNQLYFFWAAHYSENFVASRPLVGAKFVYRFTLGGANEARKRHCGGSRCGELFAEVVCGVAHRSSRTSRRTVRARKRVRTANRRRCSSMGRLRPRLIAPLRRWRQRRNGSAIRSTGTAPDGADNLAEAVGALSWPGSTPTEPRGLHERHLRSSRSLRSLRRP